MREKVCPSCKSSFIAPRKETIYCNRSCYNDYRFAKIGVDCEICGEVFVIKKSIVDKKVTCSKKCMSEKARKHSVDNASVRFFPKQSGESHWNWRGGVSSENRRFRGTKAYKDWRESVFRRDNYTCQDCGIRGGVYLQAHHLKPFSNHENLRLSLDNGTTLCIDCHKKTPTYLNRRAVMQGVY